MAKKSVSSPDERIATIPEGRGRNWPKVREQLGARLAAELERLTQHTHQTVSAALTAGGEPGDDAQSEEAVQDEASVMESHHVAIARIQAAQQRMRNDTYGICEGCGLNIPMTRLVAIPETPFCVQCAQDKERGRIRQTLEPEFALVAALEEIEVEQSLMDES
ncbi:MAG: TraR/DksA family transcriptional regulator [Candidatus Peregrinibacteria bacterium]